MSDVCITSEEENPRGIQNKTWVLIIDRGGRSFRVDKGRSTATTTPPPRSLRRAGSPLGGVDHVTLQL
ncbi:unnamed protein product [Fusarium graminearum]|uniref:Chromosome 1, complete genome n=2 Tax=Gibberella zeae TaxID=5518 RepID=A0A0E0RUY9_GIBZE|nr:hypothetical protein FG05_30121 [Fusarium graminearum]CAF3438238.1 unnamed protein product [Fusarium graminearum]CAF3584443.1 unnamed protein product [Fusarium graminearum]CAG1972512.1 unnamed protein product [Fusarium graminearum]CAG2012984.1 unnamed protein product [Fusarium graminearum]